MVQVHEDYRDFQPAIAVRERIELLLARLAPSQLQGLGSVVLTNRAALSRHGRRQKTWSRGRKVPLAESLGSYHRAWKGQGASIRILVDNVLVDVPRWALRLPVVPTVLLAMALYHEVGHHIHATSQPEHREREDVADQWSRRLTRHLVFRRYWYLALPLWAVLIPLRGFVRRHLPPPRSRSVRALPVSPAARRSPR